MTIEIRQLLIKSTIGEPLQKVAEESPPSLQDEDREALKKEILSACQTMMSQLLERQRER